MSTTINTGWLKDKNGDKFAPKTLTSQVINGEGVSVEQLLANVTIETDNTLTIAGAAADAKAVSDAINILESKIPSINGLATETYVDNAISAIPLSSKQDKLTGEQGQVVGFDENGAAISQNLTPKSIGAQPERMVVTVSKIYGSDNENDSYISDYTSSQIIDAHRNGIDVIVYAAFLYEYLYFNGVVQIVNGVLFVGNGGAHSILIRNNGTVEYNKKLYQPKITGTAGQVVGFDEDGNTVAQDFNIEPMTGATSDSNGASGLVPAPAAGDQDKFLKGDGTWAEAGTTFISGTIGTNWTEDENTGVKTQLVQLNGVTSAMNGSLDVVMTHERTTEGYAAFVEEQNQFLDYITNGDAETVDGGIMFYIYGDVNTIEIPFALEVG